MKTRFSFLIILVFFLINKSFSQLNLINKSKNQLWYITNVWSIQEGDIPHDTEILKLGDLEIVNDKEFYTLLNSIDSLITWEEIGYIREEDHKVYYVHLDDTTEYLHYDFNLELSSHAFLSDIYKEEYECEVINIDSVEIFTGERKCLSILCDWKEETWIEGIGNINGLIYGRLLLMGGGYYKLTCYYESDTLIYKNPEYDKCFYSNWTDIGSDNRVNILIYPNPSNGYIAVKGINNGLFMLYDSSGKILLKTDVNFNEQKIDISGFKTGLYYYSVHNNDLIYHGKLILSFK
ncbi:T9SS type A sorting domain-containing protein [Bacteroidota bacterium]